MTEYIDLKEIERKAWTAYFQDGLWDIFMGLLMLTNGIGGLTDNTWFTLLILAAVLVMVAGKRFITTPRLGRVKFGRSREAKQKKMVAILIISVLAMFALLLLPLAGLGLLRMWVSPIMAIWIAVIFGALAYYLDFHRLYAYGLLFALSEVLWGQFGKPIGPTVQTISGIGILLVGIAVFARFVKRYPMPSEATLNVQG